MTTTVLLVCTGLTSVTGPASAAELPLNTASRFAVNVPGSLLSQAAPDSSTGAALANAQKFNWALASPEFAAVSGSATAVPASPSTTLSPAELAEWESLTKNFVTPATRAAGVVRGAGATGLVMVALQVGLLIGQGGSRLFGFRDDEVCSQQSDGLTAVASVLDSVDCSAYENALAANQRNADQAPVSSFAPTDFHGIHVEYVRGLADTSTSYNLLTCFSYDGTLPAGYDTVHVTVWGAEGSQNGTGSNTANPNCGPGSNLSGWWVTAPLATYQLSLRAPTLSTPELFADPVTATMSIPNPQRRWECTIETSGGGSYVQVSDEFTEAGESLAPIACPAIPAGEYATRRIVRERDEDTQKTMTVQDSSTTSAYQQWASQQTECTNGSCLLDLRHDGDSCFRTTDSSECDGWLDDPNKQADYQCFYGTHQLALSECDLYGTVFNPAAVANGTAYSDPATGAISQHSTSPTKVDKLTATLLDHGWGTWDETTSGLTLGSGDQGEAARTVAKQCVALLMEDECATEPIFAPGNNIQEAALHDLSAISGIQDPATNGAEPQPAELTWIPASSRFTRDWYRSIAPCQSGTYGAPDKQCDEYPFISTQEGGPGANPPATSASLKPIPARDNMQEGYYLARFYSEAGCGLSDETRNPSHKFVVVPTPQLRDADGDLLSSGLPTSIWCEQ